MSKVHKFVITNPDLCIACNACMKTCIKHAYMRGKPSKKRLDVLTLESGKMPNQCRQCDDAPCANVCPTAALRIANSCVELCEEICIGCKLCYSVCPQKCIDITAKPVIIEQEHCLHCGRCAEICPAKAIEKRESHDTAGTN